VVEQIHGTAFVAAVAAGNDARIAQSRVGLQLDVRHLCRAATALDQPCGAFAVLVDFDRKCRVSARAELARHKPLVAQEAVLYELVCRDHAAAAQAIDRAQHAPLVHMPFLLAEGDTELAPWALHLPLVTMPRIVRRQLLAWHDDVTQHACGRRQLALRLVLP
jgi:hypothetical protein